MRIRRTELMKLTGLTRDRFDSYAKARQLALSNDENEPSGYTWFEAFLQIAVDDLCDEPKQERRSSAKATICAVGPALAARWQDIVRSAADPKLPEIVWVRLTHKHSDEGPRLSNVVGTTNEVAAAIALAPDFRKIDGGSATACAALLIRRADEQAIELPDDFWTATPAFVVEDDAAVDAMWARPIEASVAKAAK
ncbi:hypothetical protein [Bradyrhizobium sp. CB3481]|uniref:hypothetical protein n=1 Tax=Bradyrhizobium sp. CB3481 TaxID=3039158 RepID=UPI0024B225F4|nr:hypothetical protein [Bradyrhizobium sp. CB3481]WFU14423.1 hypothetical protein QA643_24920 [Bradyrhizobium sp. CB3481]